MTTNLTPELRAQIEHEAHAEAMKLTCRVPIYRQGYAEGHFDGAEVYALKWQEAEHRVERYEKALKQIEQMSDPGDYWKAICDMKAIASEALTPKQTTDE